MGSIPGLGRSPGEGRATHSNIPAWRILQTVQSMGSQGVRHNWVTFTQGIRSSETWLFHSKLCFRNFAVLLPVTVGHSSLFPDAPWHKLYILHPLTCPPSVTGIWVGFILLFYKRCCGSFLVCVPWRVRNCTVQRQKRHVGECVNVGVGRAVPNDFPK